MADPDLFDAHLLSAMRCNDAIREAMRLADYGNAQRAPKYAAAMLADARRFAGELLTMIADAESAAHGIGERQRAAAESARAEHARERKKLDEAVRDGEANHARCAGVVAGLPRCTAGCRVEFDGGQPCRLRTDVA